MDNIHHGIQEHSPPQTENHSGQVLHTLDLLKDRSGDLNLCAKTDQMRMRRENVLGEEQETFGCQSFSLSAGLTRQTIISTAWPGTEWYR